MLARGQIHGSQDPGGRPNRRSHTVDLGLPAGVDNLAQHQPARPHRVEADPIRRPLELFHGSPRGFVTGRLDPGARPRKRVAIHPLAMLVRQERQPGGLEREGRDQAINVQHPQRAGIDRWAPIRTRLTVRERRQRHTVSLDREPCRLGHRLTIGRELERADAIGELEVAALRCLLRQAVGGREDPVFSECVGPAGEAAGGGRELRVSRPDLESEDIRPAKIQGDQGHDNSTGGVRGRRSSQTHADARSQGAAEKPTHHARPGELRPTRGGVAEAKDDDGKR